MVASFLFFDWLPNWALASYCFPVARELDRDHQLVLDHYLLPHKEFEFAAL